MQIEIALLRIGLVFRAFNPDQPRVPAGHSNGGEWTSGDSTRDSFGDDDARRIFVSERIDDPYKIDLRAEEGRGGHTVGRHIGKSDTELFARLEKERGRSFFRSGGLRRNGSFADLDTANALVNETINSNTSDVE